MVILRYLLVQFIVYYGKELQGTFERRRYYYYHILGWMPPAITVAAIYGSEGAINEGKKVAIFVVSARGNFLNNGCRDMVLVQ